MVSRNCLLTRWMTSNFRGGTCSSIISSSSDMAVKRVHAGDTGEGWDLEDWFSYADRS